MYFCLKATGLKKILIIRFSSIGDIVLTTPVIRCLKNQLPGCEIHFLTKSSFLQVVEPNPYIDQIHLLNDNLEELISRLKSEKFDFIADLHNNLRSRKVTLSLGVPSKSFSKLNIRKWLFVNLKWRLMPDVHIVDRYLETVSSLGIINDNQGLDFFIKPGTETALQQLPEFMNSGFVALVIGAKHATKKLPVSQLKLLVRQLKYPVLLVGGPEDEATGNEISSGQEQRVFNGCGKFSLAASAFLVSRAGLVITHDTGLMHIAAAFGKKIISVWGNTVPEFGMYPYLKKGSGQSVIIENRELNCRPCSKIGYQKCPKKHFKCMNDLDMNELALQAEKLWNS